MDQQDNREFSQQWNELLKDAFGGTEPPAAIDTAAEPAKEVPAEETPAPETPAEGTPAPETPAKRPLYRRFWFWLILIILAAGLGIAAWFFLEKDENTEPTSPEPVTPTDTHTQEVLDQCKAGLAQWQALESYHMTQSTLFYGDNMGSATWGEFWGSGNSFMQIQYWSAGYISGVIQHDGVIYSLHSATGHINNWSVSEENVTTAFLAPWPMSFDWDASEIVNIYGTGRASYAADRSHYTSVSFSVLRSDSADAHTYPRHVNFTFDIHCNLESVTVVDVDPGEAERTGISVITYRLETTDYDIAQFIAEAPSQPFSFVLSGSPFSLPE